MKILPPQLKRTSCYWMCKLFTNASRKRRWKYYDQPQSKVIIADITSIMGRKPAGERALTNAEKQRHCQQSLSATKNNS